MSARSISSKAARPDGDTITAEAATSRSSCASAAAGLDGLSGTATRPAPNTDR